MTVGRVQISLGSLFDGIGGFPLAAVRNGMTPLWASETEAFPIAVTKIRFPDMRHVGDITKLKGANLPPVNVVTGGSPCQDLSLASGRRLGLKGERSGLFMEQIRITKELRDADRQRGRTADAVRPRYMCWENVPGAFSSGTPPGEDFRIVLEEICRIKDGSLHVPRPDAGTWKSAGAIVLGDEFSLAWRVFDAQYWPDTPQRRRRIYLVADFGGLTAPEILFKQESLFGDTAPGGGTGQGTAGAAQKGAPHSGGACGMTLTPWDTRQSRIFAPEGVAPTMTGADNGGGRNPAGLVFAGGLRAGAAPALKAANSGTNQIPSVICLNDQGGGRMDVSEDQSGALRARMDGHPPLVFENHGIDSRYTGPHEAAPTLSARYGTGGNNVPLVTEEPDVYCVAGNAIDRQPGNGGNGLGCLSDVSYTLTGTDRHAVFNRQRVDVFKPDRVAGTQSARQHKDATDLVTGAGKTPRLIRRLTVLECERLQGYPDGWTDIPGASDSARYRALGNSVAIPCVEFVTRGIAYFLRKFQEGSE